MRYGHYVIPFERNQSSHISTSAIYVRLLHRDASILIGYIVRTAAAIIKIFNIINVWK